MLVDRLETILNRIKRMLLWIAGTIVLAILAVLLLAPDAVSDFIDGIPGLIRLLLVIVVYAVIGALTYSRLQNARERRQIRGLVVKSSGGALAELSVESAREQILEAVRAVPTVISADASVAAKRGKAVITLNVAMKSDDVSLPDKQKEINRVLGKVVGKKLGLKMAERPMVQIDLDSHGLSIASAGKETATESAVEADSRVEKVERRSLDDRSDERSERRQKVAEPADPDEERAERDDEASGEFWEFLKSTGSAQETDDEDVAGSLLSSGSDPADEIQESKTDLSDVDAPIVQKTDADSDADSPEDELDDESGELTNRSL